jgi:hypothetical protein
MAALQQLTGEGFAGNLFSQIKPQPSFPAIGA